MQHKGLNWYGMVSTFGSHWFTFSSHVVFSNVVFSPMWFSPTNVAFSNVVFSLSLFNECGVLSPMLSNECGVLVFCIHPANCSSAKCSFYLMPLRGEWDPVYVDLIA